MTIEKAQKDFDKLIEENEQLKDLVDKVEVPTTGEATA